MKHYENPQIKLLAFAKEDVLIVSDENQTPADDLQGTLYVQDIQDIRDI